MEPKFIQVAANEKNPNWDLLIKREDEIYHRNDDIRSAFTRDYTRILHSTAYRRLKHKTQVFFNTGNDHICTRMEHVAHVESVSSSIATALGLNTELTKAIAFGHDLGHAPFGHQGETALNKLSELHLGKPFWHEQNGLRFVDKIELLEDNYKIQQNLNLTYAVRDGIISHCGEVDENGLFPRDISIPIEDFDSRGKYQAATWEGCVVKMADKIAYIGRDIEDAIYLGLLDVNKKQKLEQMAKEIDQKAINTTVIMHNMIIDICENSSPEKGIRLSSKFNEQLAVIKQFNYDSIYKHQRLDPFKRYSSQVINELFYALLTMYDEKLLWRNLSSYEKFAPKLIKYFKEFLAKYCVNEFVPDELLDIALNCRNKKVYGDLQTRELYIQAIIDFISGMTDRFAIELYNELLEF